MMISSQELQDPAYRATLLYILITASNRYLRQLPFAFNESPADILELCRLFGSNWELV